MSRDANDAPENKGGFRTKYAGKKVLSEIGSIPGEGNLDDAISKADEFAKTGNPTPELLQQALYFKAITFHNKEDADQTRAALSAARDAAPDTELGNHIAEILQHMGAENGDEGGK